MQDQLNDGNSKELPAELSYLFETHFSFAYRCRLLGLTVFEITGALAFERGKYFPALYAVDPNSFCYSSFRILSIDKTTVTIRHVMRGIDFPIQRISIEKQLPFLEINKIYSFGVVKMGNLWYFCSVIMPTNKRLMKSEPPFANTRFTDEYKAKETKYLEKIYQCFIDLYGGDVIFATPDKTVEIINKLQDVYNKKIFWKMPTVRKIRTMRMIIKRMCKH